MLRTIGIPATEQEMAVLCLTRSNSKWLGLPISRAGTTWLGLFHGMSTKLQGSSYRVDFFEGSVEDIEAMAQVHPVLLCCELDPGMAELLPRYVSEGGWIPGTAHSVLYLGRYGEGHLVGDPSRGYEIWPEHDLKLLWTGQGLSMRDLRPAGNPAK